MRASCICNSVIALRQGAIVCASCGAPVIGSTERADRYATTPGTWPPGARNRRQARDRIRAVPGHERFGTGRATVWSVSVNVYRAHHARQVVQKVAPPVITMADQQIADEALSGMRATRRTA